LEDVTAVVALWSLQHDEGVDVAQWTGRIVATPDSDEREQRGSDRDALCVLHSGLLDIERVKPSYHNHRATSNRYGCSRLVDQSLRGSSPDRISLEG
jgi:hypothetical protein